MLLLALDIASFACALFYLRDGLLAFRRRREPKRPPYPPGPKGWPLAGSAFDMYGVAEWEKARRWGEQYGDLVFVENFGKPYVFVNSHDVAYDLFEKRGHNYSSRPQNTLIELGGWSRMTFLMPYSDDHRKSRQVMHRYLGQSVASDHHELQTQVAHRLLLGILKEPENFLDLTRRSAADVIMMVAYGYKIQEGVDPYVDLVDRGMRSVTEAEEPLLINMLPWLQHLPKWLPGTGFHKIIKEGLELSTAILYEPYEMTKKKFYEGTAIPSMTTKLLDLNSTEEGEILDEPTIATSTAVTYAAGADTTVSTLNTLVLAMVLHPDVQQRAHEELDRVVGKDNLPTMEDESNLPYISAIINEVMRWQTVAPFGLAHSADEDDVYNGYFIPAGTTMLSNIWAMHRDPSVYPEPDKFIPERWLQDKPPLDVRKTAFGFGRRICPGRFFAENAVFIAIASILATFDINKALDAAGEPITPAVDYIESFIRHPKSFKCRITPRSDAIARAVHQVVESAK